MLAWYVAALLSGAANPAAIGADIHLNVIDGKLCARCTLSGPRASIPANVTIDLGLPVPLVVHERTAGLLGLSRGSPAGLKFDGVQLSDLPATPMELAVLEELTREHASELADIPAVAVVGLPAFADYTPQLEIAERVLRLLPRANVGETGDALAGIAHGTGPAVEGRVERGPAQASAGDEGWVIPYEAQGPGYWLAGVGPGEFRLRVQFSTAQHDTVIDATVADLLGAAGGDLDRLTLGPVNIAGYVALRPEDLSTTPEPHPDVVLGTNLLALFRVAIDTVNRKMQFEQVREARFPEEERAYFMARADEDADAIERFLQDHGTSRLAREAARRLLALRLDEYPPDRERIGRAMRWQVAAARPERRAETMLALADELLAGSAEDKYLLASEALKLGLEQAPHDLNARAGHEIHARLGMIALRQDDLREARRHLLSAAFGLPRDPSVNLWLGEVYERLGKPVRAWSRYVQAAISDDPPDEALAGLDRLNRDAAFRASFSMMDAAELLEGRILEFHPAARYGQETAAGGTPVHLVELFTCIDHPPTQAAELASGGLAEYFEGNDVAIIEYHLPNPEPDPLASDVGLARAAWYQVGATPTAFFDGVASLDQGGGERDVYAVFSAYRSASRAGHDDGGWRFDGRATLSDGRIHGEIGLTGPSGGDTLRLHVVLCEKLVMAPGANGLFLHRQVARAALSPDDGFAIPSGPSRRLFAVHADLAKVAAGSEETILSMEKKHGIEFKVHPTYVDGRACTLVAFLQDYHTKQVLAARQFDVEDEGESEP